MTPSSARGQFSGTGRPPIDRSRRGPFSIPVAPLTSRVFIDDDQALIGREGFARGVPPGVSHTFNGDPWVATWATSNTGVVAGGLPARAAWCRRFCRSRPSRGGLRPPRATANRTPLRQVGPTRRFQKLSARANAGAFAVPGLYDQVFEESPQAAQRIAQQVGDPLGGFNFQADGMEPAETSVRGANAVWNAARHREPWTGCPLPSWYGKAWTGSNKGPSCTEPSPGLERRVTLCLVEVLPFRQRSWVQRLGPAHPTHHRRRRVGAGHHERRRQSDRRRNHSGVPGNPRPSRCPSTYPGVEVNDRGGQPQCVASRGNQERDRGGGQRKIIDRTIRWVHRARVGTSAVPEREERRGP